MMIGTDIENKSEGIFIVPILFSLWERVIVYILVFLFVSKRASKDALL